WTFTYSNAEREAGIVTPARFHVHYFWPFFFSEGCGVPLAAQNDLKAKCIILPPSVISFFQAISAIVCWSSRFRVTYTYPRTCTTPKGSTWGCHSDRAGIFFVLFCLLTHSAFLLHFGRLPGHFALWYVDSPTPAGETRVRPR
ncbi:unnamed protein product, partial [Pylaiella littoralis]